MGGAGSLPAVVVIHIDKDPIKSRPHRSSHWPLQHCLPPLRTPPPLPWQTQYAEISLLNNTKFIMINNAKLQLGNTKLNQIWNNQNYKPILTFVKLKIGNCIFLVCFDKLWLELVKWSDFNWNKCVIDIFEFTLLSKLDNKKPFRFTFKPLFNWLMILSLNFGIFWQENEQLMGFWMWNKLNYTYLGNLIVNRNLSKSFFRILSGTLLSLFWNAFEYGIYFCFFIIFSDNLAYQFHFHQFTIDTCDNLKYIA